MADLPVDIMPGYAACGAALARLGKHKRGKACLDLTRLSDVDTGVLAQRIRAGLDDPGKRRPVTAG